MIELMGTQNGSAELSREVIVRTGMLNPVSGVEYGKKEVFGRSRLEDSQLMDEWRRLCNFGTCRMRRRFLLVLETSRKRYERSMKTMSILVLPSVIARICASLRPYYCTTWYKMSMSFASMVFETPYAEYP